MCNRKSFILFALRVDMWCVLRRYQAHDLLLVCQCALLETHANSKFNSTTTGWLKKCGLCLLCENQDWRQVHTSSTLLWWPHMLSFSVLWYESAAYFPNKGNYLYMSIWQLMYHIAEIEESGVCWIGLQPIASIPLLVSSRIIIIYVYSKY